MTHEEDELRRALDARSGAPSPEFRSRLSQALSTRPATANLTPAIAVVVAVALTVTSVGVLVASRQLAHFKGAVASGARQESPSPTSVPTGEFNKFQLSAPSADVVWALYAPGKLYRSTDGGSTWSVRSMPSDLGVHPRVAFIDDHEGWWLAPGVPATQCQEANATIWHTTDAGASWQQVSARGIAQSQCKSHIWFADSRHGFVAASDDLHPATIYRTSDGGQNWAASKLLPDPPNYQSQEGGVGYQVAWLKQFGSTLYLGATGTPYIYRSSDRGASWKWFTKVPSPAVVMVTEMRWLDFTTPGQAMESINGGQQFHPFTSDFFGGDPTTAQLVFADSLVGFASSDGYLQRTVDGGAHWKRLAVPGAAIVPSPSPSSIPMPSQAVLSAPSTNVVWALVGNQFLFRSTDQGRTWQQEGLPAFSFFTDVSFVDENDGWVFTGGPAGTQCSSGGATLWQTTDAGAHWALLANVNAASGARTANSIAPEQCKENLYFIDRQNGFVDAWDPNSAPSIYRTSDGGMTWSRTRLNDPPGFNTLTGGDTLRPGPVRAFGSTFLVAASGMQPDGLHTYVFQSTDGGASWTFLSSAPSGSVAPTFVTASRWLVIDNNATGQETTDAGASWHSFTTDYQDAAGVPSVFVFADGNVGYGTVRGGVRRTIDGGAHWELIKGTWP